MEAEKAAERKKYIIATGLFFGVAAIAAFKYRKVLFWLQSFKEWKLLLFYTMNLALIKNKGNHII